MSQSLEQLQESRRKLTGLIEASERDVDERRADGRATYRAEQQLARRRNKLAALDERIADSSCRERYGVELDAMVVLDVVSRLSELSVSTGPSQIARSVRSAKTARTVSRGRADRLLEALEDARLLEGRRERRGRQYSPTRAGTHALKDWRGESGTTKRGEAA